MTMRSCRPLRLAVVGLAFLVQLPPVQAENFTIGEFDISADVTFTAGTMLRTQKRDDQLLGKLNVPGQQGLCAPDDCIDLTGDRGPNQRLVDARGGFFFGNTDDGNQNFDQGDFTAGILKLNFDNTVTWRNYFFKANLIAYTDLVNVNKDNRKFDTTLQPRKIRRNGEVKNNLAMNVSRRELVAGAEFFVFDRFLNISVGYQRIRWGEANLHLFDTLDTINPLDGVLARQPGVNALNISDLNIPVGSVLVNLDLGFGATLEAFYQLEWEPVQVEPAGSFFSSSDIAGNGDIAVLGFGSVPEDPFDRFEPTDPVGVISDAGRIIPAPAPEANAPRDSGQFGFKLTRFFSDLNGGTEISLYYSRFHSRLPLASAVAGDRSCTRDVEGEANLLNALVACEGFKGSVGDLVPGEGIEPLPIQSLRFVLDYPEDIDAIGMSFNTPFGRWGGYGEYVYRPNAPAQILPSDVLFAAAQPVLPPNDIPVSPVGVTPDSVADLLTGLGAPQALVNPLANAATNLLTGAIIDPNVVFPGARTAAPDFLTRFRGIEEVNPGDHIRGFHRTGISQAVLGALRLFSTNPFGAEDIITLFEVGASFIHDLPDPMTELPLAGNGDFTHPSAGADGTGGEPGEEGSPESTGRLNPTQQTDGFATRFSWGVRGLVELQYANVIWPRFTLRPGIIFFYDVNGISAFPSQNYVEGNAVILPGITFSIGDNIGGFLQYQHYRGSRNLIRDRDNINFTITYDF